MRLSALCAWLEYFTGADEDTRDYSRGEGASVSVVYKGGLYRESFTLPWLWGLLKATVSDSRPRKSLFFLTLPAGFFALDTPLFKVSLEREPFSPQIYALHEYAAQGPG